jgi:hypothetical protein
MRRLILGVALAVLVNLAIFAPSVRLGATGIAFDAFGGAGGTPGSSQTASITVGASATAIIACVSDDYSSVADLSVTYNGASMTEVVTNDDTAAHKLTLFYKASPTSGTHNIVATNTIDPYVRSVVGASYTGSSVTSQPEASNGCAAVSCAVTVVTANAWTILCGVDRSGNMAAGASTTERGTDGLFTTGWMGEFDSNVAVTTGSHSLAIYSGANVPNTVIVSLAPAAGGAAPANVLANAVSGGS